MKVYSKRSSVAITPPVLSKQQADQAKSSSHAQFKHQEYSLVISLMPAAIYSGGSLWYQLSLHPQLMKRTTKIQLADTELVVILMCQQM